MTEAFLSVVALIVGAATVALIVSKRSQTASVVSATTSGISTMLATALGPVTGYTPGNGSPFSAAPTGLY